MVMGVVLSVSACGGSSGEGTEVRMLDNLFSPEVLEVEAGEAVLFTNDGRVDHNAIADDGSFDSRQPSGENQKPGDTWTLTVTEPGSYPYYCSLHAVQDDSGEWQGMVGTLVVRAAQSGG